METKKNLGKKLLSLLLTLLMVISLVPLSVFSAFAEEAADSAEALAELSATIDTGTTVTISDKDGDGYYEIGNADELYAFAALVNGGNSTINAQLTADITVNTGVLNENGELVESDSYRSWTPIGNDSNQYSGTFDGCEYTVSGLYFNDSSASFVGLFSRVSGGTVENVGVVASYFNGQYYVGGVVGWNRNKSTVTNCYNTGTVSCYVNVGGVVSYNCDNSTVTNCYNTGSVSGTNFVGGVVGDNTSNSTVTNCYNTGSVSGEMFVGGVVGRNASNSTVTNCYNSGTVSGSGSSVGGVVGRNETSTVTNCYNTGTVSGYCNVGGVVGENFHMIESNFMNTVTNSYNTGSVSGSNYVGGVVGYSYIAIITNCYYLADSETDDADGTTYKTSAQFASGEVAYLLQGEQTEQVWGQNIDNDEEVQTLPVLGDARVYYGYVSCADDATAVYTNTSSASAEKPGHDWVDGVCKVCSKNCEHSWEDGVCTVCTKVCEHDYDNGFCSVCGTECEHDYDNGFCTDCDAYQPADYNAETNNHEISNAGQLYWFADKVNNDNATYGSANAVLTKDIVINEGEITSSSREYTPIGSSTSAYTGVFDGQNYAIDGLYINITDYGHWGLFGYANGATIKNFSLSGEAVANIAAENTSSSVHFGSAVGEIVYGAVVENVHSSVNYTSDDSYFKNTVAGIVGASYSTGTGITINKCSYSGTITMNTAKVDCCAGIIAYAMAVQPITVTNCGFYGTITTEYSESSNQIGGIMGYYRGYKLTLSNCISVGTITSLDSTLNGAIMGVLRQHTSANTIVVNNYYLEGATPFGNSTQTDDITDGYSSQTIEGSATAATSAQLASGEVAYLLQGEQTEQVWGQNINNGKDVQTTPVISDAKVYYGYATCDVSATETYSNSQLSETKPDHNYNNGFCTVCDAYQPADYNAETGNFEISNAGQLYWFADKVNNDNATYGSANAVLTKDIVVNEGRMTSSSTDARAWTPIGNKTYKYSGTFDGCEYTVSGLYFNDSYTSFVGLFGYVSAGAVENIGVIASYFNGMNYVGGVVGYNNSNSTVTNCYNTGSVSGAGSVGGVVGYNNSNSTVTNCYNKGSVSGAGTVSGVVGENNKGTITNCYNTGTVRYAMVIGGVVGYNYKGTVTNCYNIGTVSGCDYAGGVVGDNKEGTITNCYNEGAVSGNGCVGGVVGDTYNNSTVTNCYNTGTVSGCDDVGGVAGYNYYGTITNCYNTGTVSGDSNVGGVVGDNDKGTITNCYNTGTVSGDSNVGGVAGYNYYGTITNCYNTGQVDGEDGIGGVVGDNYDNSTVTNSYSTGTVNGYSNVGGVVGYNSGDSTVTNCFYLANYETDSIDGTTFKTSAQFESGEVAYLLQGEQTEQVWGQNIDNDEEVQTLPVLGDARVYYGYVSCADDATAVYTNTSSASAEKPGHDWVDGVCTVCYKNCEHDWNTDTGICNICELECTHEGELKAEYDWNEPYDGECYVYAEFRCAECGRYIASESGNATVSETVEAKDCMNPGYEAYTVTFEYNDTKYTDTKKFTVNSYNHTGECVNGFCPDCGGYEMPELVKVDEYNEYYAIENAGQLYWFADYINNVYNEANAVLVKDIVVNESLDAENLREWTPIGTDYANTFYGSIDGQGHTISGLYCNTEDSYVGLLGYAHGNYPIKNLGIINSFFKGTDCVGALAGYAENEISNCYVASTTVEGNSNTGTIVGYNIGNIQNCYTDTDNLVGFTYPGYGTVEKCYYLAEEETEDGGKTAEQFKSGEVAYLLQEGVVGEEIYDEELGEWVPAEPAEIWGQSIGTDAYPVLGGAKVYLVDSCDGSTQYSNTEATEAVHVGYENGFCTGCDAYQPAVYNEDTTNYEISNAGQLYWFADKVNNDNGSIGSANAVLTKDVVVNEGVLNEDGELVENENYRTWTPIGNETYKYSGTFDGCEYTISGLYFLDSDYGRYVGLFGYNTGSIKNVGVVDSYFNGFRFVGGIAGYNVGNIDDCYSTGVMWSEWHSGGITGYNNGTVTDCYSNAELGVVNLYCGGVVGYNVGNIDDCYSTGAVFGYECVGGVVGYNDNSTVTNSYNTGKVRGTSFVGGVVGYNDNSTVTNSYNTGQVAGDERSIGGVVGDDYEGTITNCYYLNTACSGGIDGTDVTGSAEAKTTDQFASGEVAYLLQGEQEEQIWGQNIDNGKEVQATPVFSDAKVYYGYATCDVSATETYSNSQLSETILDHNYNSNGFCTGCDAYQPADYNAETGNYEISNAGQLYWFADKVNNDSYGSANAVLTKDIVVNEGVLDENGDLVTGVYRSWTPIGNLDYRYSGTFDGCEYTISGLYFNDSSDDYVGLFGYVKGTVRNIGVIDSYFNGREYVGAVVAYNDYVGTITNCYNTGSVSGDCYVGGVFGTNEGTITNCYNTGSVSGNNAIGGVAGQSVYNTITNCYNTGSVSGKEMVGGVVGWHDSGTITNCYNTGTVSGSDKVGGVVGYTYYATITNCYNTGTVSGSNNVGGVVGYTYYATITNCYNTGQVDGEDGIGGVVGDNNKGTITNCYNTGAVSGDDYIGGVVSYNYGTVTNCYNTGTVSGIYPGGVSAYDYGTITNCYYLADSEADSIDGTTYKTSAQFASGEVAYLLQGEQEERIWGQNIDNGEDVQATPVFSDAKVYAVTNCIDEIVTYSNTDQTADHTWVNGICSVCGKVQNDKLAGYSISLGDKIAVNYYMLLTDTTIADANAKMVFTVPDTGSTYTVEIPVSEATVNGDYYVFTCEVAAKEMTSVIKAKLVTSDSELVLDDYSVQKYAEIILSDAEKYAKEQELVKAMLNYGAYAQLYFNYNTSNLTNSILEEADKALVETLDISAYANSVSGEQDGVNFIGGLLSLKSETAIKLYFEIDSNVDIASLDITVNGEKAEAVKNGNYYEIKISDIPAHELDEMFVVKVGDLTVNYGAFSYGNAAMSTGKETLINIVKAMYAYNQAANTYIG